MTAPKVKVEQGERERLVNAIEKVETRWRKAKPFSRNERNLMLRLYRALHALDTYDKDHPNA